jgi:hypothetical protein
MYLPLLISFNKSERNGIGDLPEIKGQKVISVEVIVNRRRYYELSCNMTKKGCECGGLQPFCSFLKPTEFDVKSKMPLYEPFLRGFSLGGV